ncbi:hypothetical protein [Alkalibacterium gilvum]|uniref:hypothetical protein n=1 Tax=Alkalibacterium gilvum TaxID=1130080 RepID=UPI003F8F3E5B
MKKVVKTLLFGFLLSIIVSTVFPVMTASADTVDDEETPDEVVQELSEEFKFYFEEVGELTEDGKYVVHNLELLQERAEAGDEYAGLVYERFVQSQSSVISPEQPIAGPGNLVPAKYSARGFTSCVFDETFGLYIGILSGDIIQTLAGYLSDRAFTAAAKLIIRYVPSLVGQSTPLSIAANLAVASATCGLRQAFG